MVDAQNLESSPNCVHPGKNLESSPNCILPGKKHDCSDQHHCPKILPEKQNLDINLPDGEQLSWTEPVGEPWRSSVACIGPSSFLLPFGLSEAFSLLVAVTLLWGAAEEGWLPSSFKRCRSRLLSNLCGVSRHWYLQRLGFHSLLKRVTKDTYSCGSHWIVFHRWVLQQCWPG